MTDILQQLELVLAERRNADPESSYVAQLHHKGLNKILEKVGEEATEAILAAKDAEQSGDMTALLSETADLWFHCMVMLSHMGSDSNAVLEVLAKRFNQSGLAEKASRENS